MKDSIIKSLAWYVLMALSVLFMVEPFLIGTPRFKKSDNYSAKDWVMTWISMAIFIPICGRIIGWW